MYNKKVEEKDDEKKENKKKKKKGFTLIELLAVIIILGVLMIIAVPSVTKYINDSRRNGYITTARNVTEGVRNLAYSGTYDLDDKNTTYYVEGSCIKTDNGFRSPYGDFEKAYVAIIAKDDGYEYYWTSVDSTGTGVKNLTKVDKLDIESIENNISSEDITTSVGIDGRSKIIVIGGDNCTKSAPIEATKMMNGETGQIKNACGAITTTIYWAVQGNKLVISDSEVSGDRSGSFAGTTAFSSESNVPWTGSSYSSNYISEVEVQGTVTPASTAYWFSNVGYSASTFTGNLSQLETCHVTNMSNMFDSCGANASTWQVSGLADWDTSKVTNMYEMFYEAGGYASSWSAGNIGNWDVSKVTNMDYMFYYVAENSENFSLDLSNWNTASVTSMNGTFSNVGLVSRNWSLGDLSNWNVSNVTNMCYMFSNLGGYNASWSLGNIGKWNTSKVTDMSYMFYDAGQSTGQVNEASFTLDLSNWDVSNVTNMEKMFYNSGGYNVATYSVNLSRWNTSNVTNTYEMFQDAGKYIPSFNITIPSTNGNGISNTTTAMYGKTTSYVMEPPYSKEFTIAN